MNWLEWIGAFALAAFGVLLMVGLYVAIRYVRWAQNR